MPGGGWGDKDMWRGCTIQEKEGRRTVRDQRIGVDFERETHLALCQTGVSSL